MLKAPWTIATDCRSIPEGLMAVGAPTEDRRRKVIFICDMSLSLGEWLTPLGEVSEPCGLCMLA